MNNSTKTSPMDWHLRGQPHSPLSQRLPNTRNNFLPGFSSLPPRPTLILLILLTSHTNSCQVLLFQAVHPFLVCLSHLCPQGVALCLCHLCGPQFYTNGVLTDWYAIQWFFLFLSLSFFIFIFFYVRLLNCVLHSYIWLYSILHFYDLFVCVDVSKSFSEERGRFVPCERVKLLRDKLIKFMEEHIYPMESEFIKLALSESRWTVHPEEESLKELAKKEGLWNLWIPVCFQIASSHIAFFPNLCLCLFIHVALPSSKEID